MWKKYYKELSFDQDDHGDSNAHNKQPAVFKFMSNHRLALNNAEDQNLTSNTKTVAQNIEATDTLVPKMTQLVTQFRETADDNKKLSQVVTKINRGITKCLNATTPKKEKLKKNIEKSKELLVFIVTTVW